MVYFQKIKLIYKYISRWAVDVMVFKNSLTNMINDKVTY